VIDQPRRGDSLAQVDRELSHVRALSEDERSALWLVAWGAQRRGTPGSGLSDLNPENRAAAVHTRPRGSAEKRITEALELAYTETETDVAIVGEVRNGREVVRHLAGDGASFGLRPGASAPIEDTYCHRLLTGRLAKVVPDARTNEQVRDLEATRAGVVGAYIGVPLTGLDARLYVLCCLAHEQRPQLGERDVLFLRDLGQRIASDLGATPNPVRR
jgi:GAF domain-containing protein